MAAFEQLYQRYRGPLYRYVLRQAGHPATANDLYQGIWEKIVKARKQYRATASLRAWLFRIAHNHVMDYYRRLKPEAELILETAKTQEAGPESSFSTLSRENALAAAIGQLPADQKEALVLKLESGLDLQTIADVTGVSRETAKSRLRYAVNKLKKALQD